MLDICLYTGLVESGIQTVRNKNKNLFCIFLWQFINFILSYCLLLKNPRRCGPCCRCKWYEWVRGKANLRDAYVCKNITINWPTLHLICTYYFADFWFVIIVCLEYLDHFDPSSLLMFPKVECFQKSRHLCIFSLSVCLKGDFKSFQGCLVCLEALKIYQRWNKKKINL